MSGGQMHQGWRASTSGVQPPHQPLRAPPAHREQLTTHSCAIFDTFARHTQLTNHVLVELRAVRNTVTLATCG
eukprot:CAMPEP_0119322666 /NCGR_PEP_ID=MMETSP1333-20130426/58834_1 /TAXON_ID=418940 /ORGANISM="Scyphosphaera apsteinii, Strain RCC1455" /LENGTH=72 /DNA_ID=CAMNT_0007329951 /DNA_START=733 /DNA_END=947 /DNA_ORIENTATION=+